MAKWTVANDRHTHDSTIRIGPICDSVSYWNGAAGDTTGRHE